MKPRLTVTKRIQDGLYLSASARPYIPRPSGKGLLIAFLIGAALFIIFGLGFVAAFG